MPWHIDVHDQIPGRRQLAEPLADLGGGGPPQDHARPDIRERAGFLDSNPNPVARVLEELERSGYRPLAPGLTAQAPSSIPGVPPHGGPRTRPGGVGPFRSTGSPAADGW